MIIFKNVIGALTPHIPTDISLLKVNNRNPRTKCDVSSKFTIKKLRSGVFIGNFEHISHLVLVFLLNM